MLCFLLSIVTLCLLQTAARASYSLMLTSNAWFVFLRLHHLLCERMSRLKRRAQQLTEEDEADARQRSASDHVTAAEALKFLPKRTPFIIFTLSPCLNGFFTLQNRYGPRSTTRS
jgi:hypothetical protein